MLRVLLGITGPKYGCGINVCKACTSHINGEAFNPCQRHRVSADTVADLLRQEGFGLQSNVKALEGKQNPDRDAQFRYLGERVKQHQADSQPVISVDTKKKELIGQFANTGRQRRPGSTPPLIVEPQLVHLVRRTSTPETSGQAAPASHQHHRNYGENVRTDTLAGLDDRGAVPAAAGGDCFCGHHQ